MFGTLDTTATLYKEEITYTCINGYVFPDGAKELKIKCEGNPPAWTPANLIESTNCTRKSEDD